MMCSILKVSGRKRKVKIKEFVRDLAYDRQKNFFREERDKCNDSNKLK